MLFIKIICALFTATQLTIFQAAGEAAFDFSVQPKKAN